MGCSKSSSKNYSDTLLALLPQESRKKKKSLTLHLKRREKEEQIKPEVK